MMFFSKKAIPVFWVWSMSVSMLFSCAEKRTVQNQTAQKNVLFIAIDDLRPELPAYGNRQVKSPVMDQLADRGYIFTQAYCQMSWCSPSRTSLLTGLRLNQTNVYDLQTHFRQHLPEAVTLPQYFKNNGYQTYGFGKIFHNDSLLQDSLSWTKKCWLPPLENPILAYATERNKEIATVHGNKSYPTEKADVTDDAYPDGMVAEQAIQQISQLSVDQPFFLGVGFYKPHMPFTAPKKYWDLYEKETLIYSKIDKAPVGAPEYAFRTWSEPESYYGVQQNEPFDDSLSLELVHGYYACISFVDAQIGKIIEALRKRDFLDNTIIVIWGDHGWKLREYGHWSKHSNLDIDTRVPFILLDPDNQTQRKINAVVELIDLYPTLVSMAGLKIPEKLPGQNLSETIRGKPAKNFAISQIIHDQYQGNAIRTPEYRYIEWQDVNKTTVFREIYDFQKDSIELINRINEDRYKDVADSLSVELNKYI